MNIFISYSVADLPTVENFAKQFPSFIEPLYWDHDQEPGSAAWPTIHGWVDSSSCLVAIITDHVVSRGEAVNQEIGYAKAKGKTIIPLVAPTVDKSRLGCLQDITYIEFDPDNPGAALVKLVGRLATINRSELIGAITVLGGLAALYFFGKSQ